MPSESFKFALYDIRDNILLAQRFVLGLTFDSFKDSRMHVYATTRALEIISEASRRLPDDFRGRHAHFALALNPRRGQLLPASVRRRD
jgi:uncharacterized protein with HEPN domain